MKFFISSSFSDDDKKAEYCNKAKCDKTLGFDQATNEFGAYSEQNDEQNADRAQDAW